MKVPLSSQLACHPAWVILSQCSKLALFSIARRIIATLHQAGVTKIVVVTGYNAEVLERHLAKCGVIFLCNKNYRTTQMFDSAKIGPSYMLNKCKSVLFTSVDIPLLPHVR